MKKFAVVRQSTQIVIERFIVEAHDAKTACSLVDNEDDSIVFDDEEVIDCDSEPARVEKEISTSKIQVVTKSS